MRGIDVFMESLTLHGVDAIFGNPGTTENPLIDSLIDHPGIGYYVALHEAVAVCAAGYYAQASGKTGFANVHVAPGLGNAIGMIYGSLKANSPLIVTAGQQDTRMRFREPLLSHDLVAMARPVTKWSAELGSADEVGPVMRRAFEIANEPPMGPVFVALPIDVMCQQTGVAAEASGPLMGPYSPSADTVSSIVSMMLKAQNPAIIACDDVARSGAVSGMVELAEKTGASVYGEAIRGHASFPNRHPSFAGRLPVEAAGIRRTLSRHDFFLVTDGPVFEEVWFDEGGFFPEGGTIVQISHSAGRLAQKFPVAIGVRAGIGETVERLLTGVSAEIDSDATAKAEERNRDLADRCQAQSEAAVGRVKKEWHFRPMTPRRAVHEIQQALPEKVVVVDESISASFEVGQAIAYRGAGDYYGARGGGIGQGLAGAIGVKVAVRDRPVVCISGDGSAMYSIQAYWSAAHHNLPIVFIILSNREYRVLKHNLDTYRKRFSAEGELATTRRGDPVARPAAPATSPNRPYPHMDLVDPELDFVSLGRGMGIDGECIEDPEELGDAVKRAFESGVPYIIEVVISGKQ